jgi:ribosome-associated toxin RatA of RatAB toxin-antitoxin module
MFGSTMFECSKDLQRVKPVQMFLVVRDVSSYPLFIKWVESCRLTRVTSEHLFDAEMGVNFTVYRGAFISTAQCVVNEATQEYKIVSTTTNSPMFESLVSTWHIKPYAGTGCTAKYHIEFKFNNILYQSASNYIVGLVGHKTLDCFIERAKGLYERQNMLEISKMNKEAKTQVKDVGLIIDPPNHIGNQSAARFEFLARDEDIEREILIFQTLKMLEQEGTMTTVEMARCKSLYFSDRHFAFQMKTLFQMFNTKEEILANQNKILFHIKTLISQCYPEV